MRRVRVEVKCLRRSAGGCISILQPCVELRQKTCSDSKSLCFDALILVLFSVSVRERY